MTARMTIASRFRGPPDSANGGYSAGLVAAAIEGPAEVTLRRPPPLERPVVIAPRRDGAVMLDGDALVAEGEPTVVDVEVPGTVTVAAAHDAATRCPTLVHPDWHPFPGCFVCGPERAVGDGLRIFPGPVTTEDAIWASPWLPGPDLGAGDGRVVSQFVWAALDCPSSSGIYVGGRPTRPYVLGRIAARIDERPVVGEPHVLLAWKLGNDGRKMHSASALQDAQGRVLAVARATWIGV